MTILLGTAVTLAFVHTLVGVDHSLPFILLARAEGWSLRRLLAVTAVCGLGHVLSSVLLGVLGIGLGVAVEELEWIETSRGGLAARLLIGFGLAYAAWSFLRTLRGRRHHHQHAHADGTQHEHEHSHQGEHFHVHAQGPRVASTFALFVIFALGPCEPLIPLLVAPALEHHWLTAVLVATAFSAVTIGTMLAVVAVGFAGLQWRGFACLERHLATLAGLSIAASGAAIVFFGL